MARHTTMLIPIMKPILLLQSFSAVSMDHVSHILLPWGPNPNPQKPNTPHTSVFASEWLWWAKFIFKTSPPTYFSHLSQGTTCHTNARPWGPHHSPETNQCTPFWMIEITTRQPKFLAKRTPPSKYLIHRDHELQICSQGFLKENAKYPLQDIPHFF